MFIIFSPAFALVVTALAIIKAIKGDYKVALQLFALALFMLLLIGVTL